MLIIIIIAFMLICCLLYFNTTSVKGGGASDRITASDVIKYLDDYLQLENGKKNLITYLAAHYDFKEPPDELHELIRRIIRDKDIDNITDFLEKSHLTYLVFLDDNEKVDVCANSLKYEITAEDHRRIYNDAKSLLIEMGLRNKYDEYDIRKIVRRNASSWKILAKDEAGKLCLDVLAIRVLLRNYIKCSCLDEKEQLAEMKRLVTNLTPNMPDAANMANLIRVLRELKDYKYMHPYDNLDEVALRLGLDRDVLETYKRMYPDLTIEQILRELLAARGANEVDVELSEFAKDLVRSLPKANTQP